MFSRFTQAPELLSAAPLAMSRLVPEVILFTDEPQLTLLIAAVLSATGIAANLTRALPAEIYGIQAETRSLDVSILDLPFEVDENEVSLRIERLRQAFPSVRVLLMSGCALDEKLPERLLHRDVWFLPKPFNIARLAGTLRETLEGEVRTAWGQHDRKPSLRRQ